MMNIKKPVSSLNFNGRTRKLYKFFATKDMRSPFGYQLRWKVGQWQRHNGWGLRMCSSGIHVGTSSYLRYLNCPKYNSSRFNKPIWEHGRVFEVEIKGETLAAVDNGKRGAQKWCCSNVKLVRELKPWEIRKLIARAP